MTNPPTFKEDKYYFCPAPPDRDVPFYIELAGITYPNINYHIDRRERPMDFFVLEYVRAGRGCIECGDARYTVGPGDFYLLNRNRPHRYYADRQDPFTKIWLNAGGRLIAALLEAYRFDGSVFVRHVDVDDLFEDISVLLRRMSVSGKNETYRAVAAKVCEILVRAFSEPDAGEPPNGTTAGKIRAYIDAGINLNISLSDIAGHFFLDKSYVIQLFRREFGITPKQYILKKKCDAAKHLLADPAVSIKEITELLGFSSTQHFSSVFRRRCGKSPDTYRKEALLKKSAKQDR